jgi:hypothetical protein
MTFEEAVKIIRTMEFADEAELALATEIICTAAERGVAERRDSADKARNEKYARDSLEAKKEALIWRNPFGDVPQKDSLLQEVK